MSLKLGFAATLEVNGHSIVTIGDVQCDTSKTEVEVKNRACRRVRYLAGMESDNFEVEVQAGTDPEDPNSVDGYDIFKNAYDNDTVLSVTYTSPGGFSITRHQIVTSFKPNDPVDGLSTASVTLKESAKSSEGSSSSSSSSI